MKRKIILTGIVLFSMLLFAACGEEKPLADRVIENLEDCMGAREVTEEEYEELKRKNGLFPTDFMRFLQQENVYLNYKEEDLSIANTDLSFYAGEDIEVNSALIYKSENRVDDKNSYMTVSIFEFTSSEYEGKYIDYLELGWDIYYSDVKDDNTSQKLRPKDRKMGKNKGDNYVHQKINYGGEGTYVENIYLYWDKHYVMEVIYCGYEDNEIYPKYQKFLKKMKFEGLNDIELEYAEPQS